jgi:DNA (cytosine-5)-methyltransferase 1
MGRGQHSRTPELDYYEALYTREEVMLLNSICEEIESEGYAVQPIIIPAVSLEADHERKRVWIVARRNAPDSDSTRADISRKGRKIHNIDGIGQAAESGRDDEQFRAIGDSGRYDDPDSDSKRLQRWSADLRSKGAKPNDEQSCGRDRGRFENWYEATIRTCARRVDDGTTAELDQLGSRDNRGERLKALGNAIYWKIAYEIFKAIEITEEKWRSK